MSRQPASLRFTREADLSYNDAESGNRTFNDHVR